MSDEGSAVVDDLFAAAVTLGPWVALTLYPLWIGWLASAALANAAN